MNIYREGLALKIRNIEDLDALYWIYNIFRIWRQFSDPLLKMEDLFGEFCCFQTRRSQKLDSILQEHFVRVDRLYF